MIELKRKDLPYPIARTNQQVFENCFAYVYCALLSGEDVTEDDIPRIYQGMFDFSTRYNDGEDYPLSHNSKYEKILKSILKTRFEATGLHEPNAQPTALGKALAISYNLPVWSD